MGRLQVDRGAVQFPLTIEISVTCRRYLRSGLAEDDLTQILGESVSSSGAGKGKVGYLARLLGIHRNNTAEGELCSISWSCRGSAELSMSVQ